MNVRSNRTGITIFNNLIKQYYMPKIEINTAYESGQEISLTILYYDYESEYMSQIQRAANEINETNKSGGRVVKSITYSGETMTVVVV